MGFENDEMTGVVYKPQHDGKHDQKLQPDNIKKKNDTWFLYFSAFTANLVFLSGSMDMVWTSPVIPKLQSNDTTVNPLGRPISHYEISLIAGLPRFGAILGTIAFAKLPDIVGRKKCLVYMALAMTISNLLVSFGNHIYYYYIGRTLFCTFLGGVTVCLPVYLCEIAEDHNRVKYMCLMSATVPIGTLLSYIFGPITSVKIFTLLTIAPVIAFLLIFTISVPESPVYLASKGKRIETMIALQKLRSNKDTEQINKDYQQIERELEARKNVSNIKTLWPFTTKPLKRAFLIATVINMAHHCAGSSVIMPFLGPMFNEAHTNLSGNNVAILVGIIKIFIYFATSFIVEKSGRRPLLLLSSAASGVPLFFLGLYFYWKNTNASFLGDIRWLPIVIIIVFIISYAIGLGPLPTAITGELFPSDIKSLAMSYQMIFVNLVITVWTFSYPIVAHYLGIQYCLWLFSMNCFIGLIGIYYILPETKGKSILEIQKMLSD
ncbi:unnamed protein product [Phaedon cochleariae]|uniref:Major facilitator superfamily (MFS) profile domain-containing protein n=1 Tax=Phaedon cochleariae TaxID=80249 RepID=A0A9N9SHP8_PHACE|nr:unnamed protein product [Phaedon cochleariae]